MLSQGGAGVEGDFNAGFNIERNKVFVAAEEQGVWNVEHIPARHCHFLAAVDGEPVVHACRPIEGGPEPGPRNADIGDINLDLGGRQIAKRRGEPAVGMDAT